MKSSNDTIGNRTRDLPVFSAVPQPTAPPRDPPHVCNGTNFTWQYSPVTLGLLLLVPEM